MLNRQEFTFVSLLTPSDQAALVSFDKHVTTEQGFTTDKALLTTAINDLQNGSGTALYDAVIHAMDLAETVPGNRAIVLLTDGRDSASEAELDAVLQRVAGRNIPIYGIGLGLKSSGRGRDELRAIAEGSGGIMYETPTSTELEEIYRDIAFLISRTWYRVTYTTQNRTTDGTVRQVGISANDQTCSGVGDNSYTAPDHVPTITPTTQDELNPAQDFCLDVEIPATSKTMQNLYDLRVVLQYDQNSLKVKEPHANNITPTSFFGQSADFTFIFQIDAVKGEITLQFQRKTNLPPAEGQGPLAKICFAANTSMPNGTALSFNIIGLEAKDETGWPVAVNSGNLDVNSFGLVVWPGDTNHNGTVELSDVNILGLYWGIAGPPRTGSGDQNQWQPRIAGQYPRVAVAHADANGTGTVEERDLFPIGLNWRKTQTDYFNTVPKGVAAKQEAPDGKIMLELKDTSNPDEYYLTMRFDNTNQAEFAGLAFRLDYPGDAVAITSVVLGDIWGSAPLAIRNDDVKKQIFAMGLIIPTGSPTKSNSGRVMDITLRVSKKTDINDFNLHDVAVVSPTGELREISAGKGNENVHSNIPSGFSLNPAYPNPFHRGVPNATATGTVLQVELPENAVVSMTVFNAAGQRVRSIESGQMATGRHALQWNGLNDQDNVLGNGIYFIRVKAVGNSGRIFQAVQRVSLVK